MNNKGRLSVVVMVGVLALAAVLVVGFFGQTANEYKRSIKKKAHKYCVYINIYGAVHIKQIVLNSHHRRCY